MAFSDDVKQKALTTSGGRCECTRTGVGHTHVGRCPTRLTMSSAEFHHITAQSAGGSGGLANCEVLCSTCHKSTASYGRHY